MSDGNGSGSYRISTKNQLAAFDKLPRSARRAMAEARFDWATPPFATMMRKDYRMTGNMLADIIRANDEANARRTKKRTWGKDYPDLKGVVRA